MRKPGEMMGYQEIKKVPKEKRLPTTRNTIQPSLPPPTIKKGKIKIE